MKLQEAPPNIYLRYTKLKTMAERGTKHEAEQARNKLSSLEKKYVFGEAPPEIASVDDLFGRAFEIKPNPRGSQSVRTFKMEESEVGSFAKWALQNAFKIEVIWKAGKGNATELCVRARKADVPYLRHVVDVIVESFQRLWRQFRADAGAPPADENPFYRGLYDGMMRDPRSAGESIPMPPPPKKRPKAKSRAAAISGETKARAHVRPHTYEIACALGKKIRLSHSLEQVVESLEILLRVAEKSDA